MLASPAASEVLLGRRQLYMLPAGSGVLFAFALLVLLLAAVNYGSALAFGLTFLLAAVGIVSMLYTHRNLLGLRVSSRPCAPVFAGDQASFQVCLKADQGPPRLAVRVEHGRRVLGSLDLAPGVQACVRLEVPTNRRGFVRPPPVVISTRFPLGLLYAWSRRIQLSQRCLVYPQPAAYVASPVVSGRQGWQDHGRDPDGDDFLGLREFRKGDSPRRVSWKAVARGRGMLSKQFGGGYRAKLWLDWESLPDLDSEQRLKQLCRWVLDCEQAGAQYGLRLPNTTLAPASGDQHRHRCLAALALFPG
ncbi:MAG: DUF58 domain-containing protein [Acidiferrobacterales bacterium]